MPMLVNFSQSAAHRARSVPRHHPDVSREKANMLNTESR